MAQVEHQVAANVLHTPRPQLALQQPHSLQCQRRITRSLDDEIARQNPVRYRTIRPQFGLPHIPGAKLIQGRKTCHQFHHRCRIQGCLDVVRKHGLCCIQRLHHNRDVSERDTCLFQG